MRLLSIDTSSNLLSVALAENYVLVASESRYMERGQGEALIPIIQTLCQKAQWDITSLNQVISAIGPGSFTGVRIALATARGIGLALNIPAYGMTNFDSLTMPDMPYPLCVALDTKRGDCYTQIFESYNKTQSPQIRSLSDIIALNLPVLTDNITLFDHFDIRLIDKPFNPAANMIHSAKLKPSVLKSPDPLYLREADVTLSVACVPHVG